MVLESDVFDEVSQVRTWANTLAYQDVIYKHCGDIGYKVRGFTLPSFSIASRGIFFALVAMLARKGAADDGSGFGLVVLVIETRRQQCISGPCGFDMWRDRCTHMKELS